MIKKINFLYIFFLLLLLPFTFVKAQTSLSETLWIDSVFKTMSSDERIGQLFMVKASSNGDKKYYENLAKLICDYKVGGVAFFKGGPVREANWTNRFQQNANIPLLIAIDGEWGLGMRLDSTPSFPRQITLGAIRYDSLIFQMGKEIGRECKRLGINMNFAPVVDINSNPRNPVINSRSFGENKYNVAKKGVAYMKGMQSVGVLACAKHFPGHGDTDTDSHFGLPTIKHSKRVIDSLDLYPFNELIKNNVSSVMVAHLNVPALDPSGMSISSLSKTIITDLLKKKMGFKGLVFTDALDMKGVSANHKNGTAELKALMAGNDILLIPESISEAVARIRTAIDSSVISSDLINQKCKKILMYKYKAGLNHYKPIDTD
ncbi:MAG: hypothetical protein HGB12_13605, partial [Bacteroidetes bacterium]|nr:hypothetical protein [Bacteroidota bacterium]